MKPQIAEVQAEPLAELWAAGYRALQSASMASYAFAEACRDLYVNHVGQGRIADRYCLSQSYISRAISTLAYRYDHDHTERPWPNAYDMVIGRDAPRTLGTGQDEWYTPSEYIALVEKAMGGIDLDPASCPAAQKIVNAGAFLTEEEDGLSREWFGRVFMNPPYSQPKIGQFVEKLISEFDASHVKEAVALTTNNTDTDWFQALARNCTAMCFTDGRISFIAPDGRKPSPNQGHVFTYFGDDPAMFQSAFALVGVTFRKF